MLKYGHQAWILTHCKAGRTIFCDLLLWLVLQ